MSPIAAVTGGAHRAKVRHSPPAVAGGGNETVVAAALYNDTGSNGSKLVSCGVPLPIGAMTTADVAAKKFRVFVGGVEQQIHCSALRGSHIDGTVRAVKVQFTYTFSSAGPVTAEVRYGVARETTDISETAVTEAMLVSPVMILPTSPAYLCSCDVSMQPLIPASEDDPEMVDMYQSLCDSRIAHLATQNPVQVGYNAWYDVARGVLAQWARTGNVNHWRFATKRAYAMMKDFVGDPAMYTPWNPQQRTGEGAPVRLEQSSQHKLGAALCYYTTADHQLWLMGDYWSARGYNGYYSADAMSHPFTGIIDGGDDNGGLAMGPRFNLQDLWMAAAAPRFHFTLAGFTGNGGPKTLNHAVELPWILDAIYINRFGREATDPNDWRKDMSGSSGKAAQGEFGTVTAATSTTVTVQLFAGNEWSPPRLFPESNGYATMPISVRRGPWGNFIWQNRTITTHTAGNTPTITVNAPWDVTPQVGEVLMFPYLAGDVPTFQAALFGQFLVFVYTRCLADARLPAMIKAQADALIATTRTLEPGDNWYGYGCEYGWDYALTNVPGFKLYGTGGENSTAPYTLPMATNVVGFCYAYYGTSTYKTWLDRYANRNNVQNYYAGLFADNPAFHGSNGKYFGETFGNCMDTPFWRKGMMPAVAPSTVPTLPVYTD